MDKVLFDCERMKYPYTGLYYFCRELGQALIRQTASAAFRLAFYVPEKEKGVLVQARSIFCSMQGISFFRQGSPSAEYGIAHTRVLIICRIR